MINITQISPSAGGIFPLESGCLAKALFTEPNGTAVYLREREGAIEPWLCFTSVMHVPFLQASAATEEKLHEELTRQALRLLDAGNRIPEELADVMVYQLGKLHEGDGVVLGSFAMAFIACRPQESPTC